MYDIEYMRYWPRWMAVKYPPSSGSLLATFWLSSWLSQYADIKRDLQDYAGERGYSSWGQQRLAWAVYYSELQPITTNITFQCTEVTGIVNRAVDIYDFMHSTTPVFYFDTTGIILLRNLEVKELLTTPASDFSVTVDPIIEDCDVWYKTGNEYERLQAQSQDINTQGIIYLPNRVPTRIRYSSKVLASSLDASGTIQVNGGPLISIVPLDLKNGWDDIGASVGIQRLPREDNYSYYLRIKSSYYLSGGTTVDGLNSATARHTDNILTLTWIPTGALDLSGLHATSINIYGLNKDGIKAENLRKISDNIYRTSYTPKKDTLKVYVGGFSTQPVSSTNNEIYFYNAPLDTAQAVYGYQSYTITKDSSGYITTVTPVSGNINTSKEYIVYIASAVKAYTLSSKTYGSNLFNPDGTATTELLEVSQLINKSLQVSLGYVTWNNVTWFSDTDIKPEIRYVPRTLDI